jgi:hypothetical protein
MKRKMKCLLPYAAIIVPLASPLSGETLVKLFLEADKGSVEVATVSLEDARLGQATPVLDEEKAALGWHFADFAEDVDAYVPDAKIGKDLLPVENAVLFSAPSGDSTVLGTYKKGDPIEVVDTGEWWKILYGGGFPVYFVLETPPPLPPVTATADEGVAAPMDAPVMIEEATLVDDTPEPVVAVKVPQPESQPPPPGVVGQPYQGTFKRSKLFLGLIKPKAPYYLEGPEGNRIAWVDPSGIVVPGSMKDYVDKQVILHGERTQVGSSKDWIIHARNMRLK